jgi:hypothetical protein
MRNKIEVKFDGFYLVEVLKAYSKANLERKARFVKEKIIKLKHCIS